MNKVTPQSDDCGVFLAVPIGFGELYKSRWECLPGNMERLFDYLRCDLIRVGAIDAEVNKVVSGGPCCRDGYLYMPDRPGVGCDIDEELAAQYPYRRAYIPVCRQDDQSLMTW